MLYPYGLFLLLCHLAAAATLTRSDHVLLPGVCVAYEFSLSGHKNIVLTVSESTPGLECLAQIDSRCLFWPQKHSCSGSYIIIFLPTPYTCPRPVCRNKSCPHLSTETSSKNTFAGWLLGILNPAVTAALTGSAPNTLQLLNICPDPVTLHAEVPSV